VPAGDSAADAIRLIDSLSNWGRWGSADRRGTLNFVDEACVTAATALVNLGACVSCSWDVHEIRRFMKRTGEG
jgi:hypothetical protein